MESQLRDHTNLAGESEEQGGEKQSVMKKMKAKARKIKDTIKKHGHHHGHDHDHHEPHTELDDEIEEEEEEEEDPEVHGAPIYESQTARNPVVGLGGGRGAQHQPILERTDETERGPDHTRLGVPTSQFGRSEEATKLPVLDKTDEAELGPDHTRLGIPTSHFGRSEEASKLPERTNEEGIGADHTRLGIPTSLFGRSEEASKLPIMERTDEAGLVPDHTRLGIQTSLFGRSEEAAKLPVLSLEEDLGAPKHTLSEQSRPGNYQTKVNDPTGQGAEETPGVSPLLSSLEKMALADKATKGAESHDQVTKYRDIPDDSPLITGEALSQGIATQGGYSEKLAYATAALADKVTAVKDAAAAKLGYGNEGKDITNNDQADQASHTEKEAQAASPLAEKAAGAKDVVASKLGYGGTGEHKTPREPVDHEALMQQGQSHSGKISGITSGLAEKAVEAKNVLASKLGYDQEGADVAEAKNPDHASGVNKGSAASTVADKADQVKNAGYVSQAGNGAESTTWTEKLKPGEEDKALSELITGTVLQKEPSTLQEDEGKRPILETVSDTVVKREEVSNVPGGESPGKGVTEKIKVAVSSWWSSGDPQPDTSQTGAEERRLQESRN